MTDVKASVEYKIILDDNSFLLDNKKYQLLESILNTGSLRESAEVVKISYRTALNYIEKIESNLQVKIVNTSKGGKGGGGCTTLTEEGYSILKECKKINAIMELHRDVNEIESEVLAIDEKKGVMTIGFTNLEVNIPLNNK